MAIFTGDEESGEADVPLVSLKSTANPRPRLDAALDATHRANRSLLRMARADGAPKTIGTTVVGLIVDTLTYYCFWVGASRSYRVRSRTILPISRDHSLIRDLIDANVISADEAHDHPSANVITRAVGVAEELQIDVVSGEIQPGDIFLLASDGLTRVINDQELVTELSNDDLTRAADRLIQMVLDRGAPDNVTLIAISF